MKAVIGLLAGLFGTYTSDDCRMKSDRRQKVLFMTDKHNVRGKSKMKERVFNHFSVLCLKTQLLSINQRIAGLQ